MKKMIQNMLDIRDGEGLRCILMFCCIFLMIASLMIVKPVCSALFLNRFGVRLLPHVFLLVACLAMAFAKGYAVALKKMAIYRIIHFTLWAGSVCLLIFWLLLRFGYAGGWILFLFYAWMTIFNLIAASQFWILANSIFNVREARRLFSFIGSGAITGGIFGGYLTNFIAPRIGTLNMLWFCIGFFLICIRIVTQLRWMTEPESILRKYREVEPVSTTTAGPFRLILGSPHLRLIAVIFGISVLVGKLVEYQFSAISSAQIPQKDELTAFFGFWLSNMSMASLGVQLFLTRRIVGGLGVGASLFFLPGAVALGAVLVLFHPTLFSAVCIKMCDGSLKNSINKAGAELLILPVPREVRNQTKAFIDIFMDSFATGISGLLLIGLTAVMDFSVQGISIFILILILLWTVLIFRVQREYIHSFLSKILSDPPSPGFPPPVENNGVSVIGQIVSVLEGEDLQQAEKVLSMIRDTHHPELAGAYEKLAHHPHPAIRAEALKQLYFYPKSNAVDQARKLIRDPDLDVSAAAIQYLYSRLKKQGASFLDAQLTSDDYRIRGAALLCAARESRRSRHFKQAFNLCDRIIDLFNGIPDIRDREEKRFTKIVVARIIGIANIPHLHPYLYLLIRDPSEAVVRAAVTAAGSTRRIEFLKGILPLLGRDSYHQVAAAAIRKLGGQAVDTLIVHMDNPLVDRAIRMNIPAVLAEMGTQKVADLLTRHIQHPDLALRYKVIRAMNRLRTADSYLKFDNNRIIRGILDEARDHLLMLSVIYCRNAQRAEAGLQRDPSVCDEQTEGLKSALEKRLDINLERIFRLMGLAYPSKEIFAAYQSLQSSEQDRRASALEFLDNLLDADLKRVVIPIVESEAFDTLVNQTLERMGVHLPSTYEAFSILLSRGDSNLRIKVLRLVSRDPSPRYIPLVSEMLWDTDRKVQETARRVLKSWGYL